MTTLKITTDPPGVETYLLRAPSPRNRPDCTTPATIKNFKDTAVWMTLFKPGYADTCVHLNLKSLRENSYFAKLQPATQEKLGHQKVFLSQRRTHRLLCYGSLTGFLGCAIAGGVLQYSAAQDYAAAREAKEYLDLSINRSGPEWDAAVAKNREKSHAGDNKKIAAWSVWGCGAVLGGIGVVLFF
jgi:hypothetical protein